MHACVHTYTYIHTRAYHITMYIPSKPRRRHWQCAQWHCHYINQSILALVQWIMSACTYTCIHARVDSKIVGKLFKMKVSRLVNPRAPRCSRSGWRSWKSCRLTCMKVTIKSAIDIGGNKLNECHMPLVHIIMYLSNCRKCIHVAADDSFEPDVSGSYA